MKNKNIWKSITAILFAVVLMLAMVLSANAQIGGFSRDLGSFTLAQNEANQVERWVWSEPVNVGPPINTAAGEFAPRLSQDMLTMFFVAREERGGYGLNDIWMATRDSIDAPWGEPVNLGPPINTEYHDLFPCLSPDGLVLYFDSTRPGGYGDEDIYVSTRDSKGAPWGEPVNLNFGPYLGGPAINTAYCECQPVLSPDMLSLHFCSDRPVGYGGGDIYVSTRDSKGAPWGEPVNLGPSINTEYGEWNPSISPDGLTLYFDSEDRPGYGTGYGEADIWMATRDSIDAPWGEPVNLGPPINTEYGAYTPWICYDGATLYFHSGLPGGYGGGDIWRSSREPILPKVPTLTPIGIAILSGILGVLAILTIRRRKE